MNAWSFDTALDFLCDVHISTDSSFNFCIVVESRFMEKDPISSRWSTGQRTIEILH